MAQNEHTLSFIIRTDLVILVPSENFRLYSKSNVTRITTPN